jgi:hypothetical protein
MGVQWTPTAILWVRWWTCSYSQTGLFHFPQPLSTVLWFVLTEIDNTCVISLKIMPAGVWFALFVSAKGISGLFKSPNRHLPIWELFQAVLWRLLTKMDNTCMISSKIMPAGVCSSLFASEKGFLLSFFTKFRSFQESKPAAACFRLFCGLFLRKWITVAFVTLKTLSTWV